MRTTTLGSYHSVRRLAVTVDGAQGETARLAVPSTVSFPSSRALSVNALTYILADFCSVCVNPSAVMEAANLAFAVSRGGANAHPLLLPAGASAYCYRIQRSVNQISTHPPRPSRHSFCWCYGPGHIRPYIPPPGQSPPPYMM